MNVASMSVVFGPKRYRQTDTETPSKRTKEPDAADIIPIKLFVEEVLFFLITGDKGGLESVGKQDCDFHDNEDFDICLDLTGKFFFGKEIVVTESEKKAGGENIGHSILSIQREFYDSQDSITVEMLVDMDASGGCRLHKSNTLRFQDETLTNSEVAIKEASNLRNMILDLFNRVKENYGEERKAWEIEDEMFNIGFSLDALKFK